MLTKTTAQAFARYHLNRREELGLLAQRLSRLYGLPNIQVSIDSREKTACKLTRDGVVVAYNPDRVLEISGRNWSGAKNDLPVALADLIMLSHVMSRARDFTDTDFYIETPKDFEHPDLGRNFFNTTIDDIVIDMRLRRIPLFSRYFDAFASRLIDHEMANLPLNIQLMQVLRLCCLEHNPQIICDPLVLQELQQMPGQITVIRTMADPQTTFAKRHQLADRYIYSHFENLLKLELERSSGYLINKQYEAQTPYGVFENADPNDFLDFSDKELKERQDLYNTVAANLEDIPLAALKNIDEFSEAEDDGSPGLTLPRRGEATEELELEEADKEPGYLETVIKWQTVIKGVADVLLKLATPQESIVVPRYRHVIYSEGVRLNPSALIQTTVQLQTGQPQAIWQPIKKQIRHQELQFSGLDIFLLLDVSGSMGGPNAKYATAMAVCLIEGLQLARLQAEREQTQGNVDVRTQLLAFGAGWAPLTPLCKEVTHAQKEQAFYNLMHPKSNFTLINSALKQVRSNALATPKRGVLCLIISDGLFSDNLAALRTVQNMPPRAYVGHINIGESLGIPITPHNQTIYEPKLLPIKLQNLLEEYFKTQSVN